MTAVAATAHEVVNAFRLSSARGRIGVTGTTTTIERVVCTVHLDATYHLLMLVEGNGDLEYLATEGTNVMWVQDVRSAIDAIEKFVQWVHLDVDKRVQADQ